MTRDALLVQSTTKLPKIGKQIYMRRSAFVCYLAAFFFLGFGAHGFALPPWYPTWCPHWVDLGIRAIFGGMAFWFVFQIGKEKRGV